MLSEVEISNTWRSLFGKGELSDEKFERAEYLLDQIRPESPLRHRLQLELDELRKVAAAN